MDVPKKTWRKETFNIYPKCNVLMNNIFWLFKATILTARDKSILTMQKLIRSYLMNLMSTFVTKLDRWKNNIMSIPRKRLNKEDLMNDHWAPTFPINEEWKVKHSFNVQQFIIDVIKSTCTCRFWDLIGIPCRHACKNWAIEKQKKEFIDKSCSRKMYALC